VSERNEMVLILDFGSQVTQLIARRVREAGVYCEILPGTVSAEEVRGRGPGALILSGGPDSVYEEGAPQADPAIFELGLPVLGICYGMQLLVRALGGKVESVSGREFGRALLEPPEESAFFTGLRREQTVWMSHGDALRELPPGFRTTARTAAAPHAAVEDPERRLYGVQFHPEVTHTEHGAAMLHNFVRQIAGFSGDWNMGSFLQRAVSEIREQVGEEGRVVCALSGGVDSSVMALLVHRAIGERLRCVFVDNGVLRLGEAAQVVETFRERYHLNVRAVDAAERFLGRLGGVADPEEKRRIIGTTFIEVFEEAAREIGADFLAQGTIYPDRIESVSLKGPSATIKTHHNVGGLPETMSLRLIEPLRDLFKDEVRRLGEELGLDPGFVRRHPFPGPGLAVRILGEVSAERVAILQQADAIFIEELRGEGLYDRTAQAFAVLLPVRSVGVMGDGRTYEEVIALRSVDTSDFMTADWSRLPHDFLSRVAGRIIGEVRGVNRVVYDVTSKPPGTIEWE
jgi:GMP synthase (glutamine-hydrolysing)